MFVPPNKIPHSDQILGGGFFLKKMNFLPSKNRFVFYNIYNERNNYHHSNKNKEKQIMKQYILTMPEELHRAVRIQLAKDSKTFKAIVLELLSDYAKSELMPKQGTTSFGKE